MKVHPAPAVTIAEVAGHIDHIRQVAGIDHVVIGSDFDGVPATPTGLAGENILRVLAQADAVGARLRTTRNPSEATIEELNGLKRIADW